MPLEKPRFRRDLEARPVVADGQSYIEVRDAVTARTFLFYDFEYQVALALDGLPLAKVIPWVKLATGLVLDVGQLREFAERLRELGFLEPDPEGATALPPPVESDDLASADELPGPPAPDAVFMHPTEVVGETPPPASWASIFVPRAATGRAAAAPTEGEGAAPLPAASDLLGRSAQEALPGAAIATSPLPAIAPAPPVPFRMEVPAPFDTSLASLATAGPAAAAPLATLANGNGPDLRNSAVARWRLRRSLLRFGTLGVLAAAAILAVALPFVLAPRQRAPVEVSVVPVTLGTVYRYFSVTSPIMPAPTAVLRFPRGGKVIRVMSKGSSVAAGDVVAAVAAAQPLLDQLARQRERLAYTEQMAEATHQMGNSKEEERQAAKVDARKAAIASTIRELAKVAVVATSAGEVDETMVQEGQLVAAGAEAAQLRPPGFSASFALLPAQSDLVRRLGFCQVEVAGYLLDCLAAPSSGADERVTVELSALPSALAGKAARLARARYLGAAVLPVAALRGSATLTSVLVVAGNARLEARPVVVGERDEGSAIVVQGLDPGDRVVTAGNAALRADMSVVVRGAK
jgi:multidrug efflux pump subunit AcrA (membrane-fusion protein)